MLWITFSGFSRNSFVIKLNENGYQYQPQRARSFLSLQNAPSTSQGCSSFEQDGKYFSALYFWFSWVIAGILQVEGKGNGIKTVIANMTEIAKALERPPTCKYFFP